ncbi:MAG: hypothetical protein MUC29_05760 [Pyrinomonadaceae bacterium]|jgi:hypothetical protein|nr:hypothetical protein [Pyrinomonadaceae bacterium]
MSEKFEVSFNSPQCGWMSVGFQNQDNEFSSTTAHAPHERALPELLQILVNLLGKENFEKTLLWNRNPEEFDFIFAKNNDQVLFEVFEYPTAERNSKEKVFTHTGDVKEFCQAFYETFAQLYEARETDEFEQNWRQPFPYQEFTELTQQLKR